MPANHDVDLECDSDDSNMTRLPSPSDVPNAASSEFLRLSDEQRHEVRASLEAHASRYSDDGQTQALLPEFIVNLLEESTSDAAMHNHLHDLLGDRAAGLAEWLTSRIRQAATVGTPRSTVEAKAAPVGRARGELSGSGSATATTVPKATSCSSNASVASQAVAIAAGSASSRQRHRSRHRSRSRHHRRRIGAEGEIDLQMVNKISKAMSGVLRHTAFADNVLILRDGWAPLKDVLQAIRRFKPTAAFVQEVVKRSRDDDGSPRFQIKDLSGTLWIRATKKHSLAGVSVQLSE